MGRGPDQEVLHSEAPPEDRAAKVHWGVQAGQRLAVVPEQPMGEAAKVLAPGVTKPVLLEEQLE